MYHAGDFPASGVVYVPFDSFAASTGAPSAVTNFAAGDIQIYKDGGTTQRSSSAGITVTTSFDTNTGLQMIAIDTSDNTDAGFYAAGHEYQVAVADITVDAQTLRFWAATFSIERAGGALALLKATGSVKVDVVKWNSTTVATPATAGIPDVNTKNAANVAWGSGAITAASIASAALAAAKFAADTGLVPVRSATAQAGAATTITLDASASAVDQFYLNDLLYIVSGTGAGQARFISGYVGSTKVATVTTWVTNPDNTSVFAILPSDGTTIALPANFSSLSIDASGRVDVIKVAGTSQTARDLGGTLGVAGAGLTALGDTRIANLDAAVTTRLAPTVAARTLDVSAGGEAGVDWANVGSPTTTVGLSGTTIATSQVVASMTGNVGGSVASIATGGISAASFAAGAIDNAAIATDAIGSAELAASAVDEILDDQLSDSIPADGTLPTVRQALYMVCQFLFERSVASTTVTVKKADGSTSLFTLTLNDGTTPTSITRAT